MIHFEFKSGPEKGRRFSLNDERVLLGRGPHCHIKISSGSVSLKHCEVRREEPGPIYIVEDLGSSNGTRLQRQDASPIDGPRRLRSGDSIWLGDVRVEVMIDLAETRKRGRADCVVLERPTDDDIFAHQAGRRPRIRFIAGPHRDRMVLLGERPVTIGRSEQCDIVLHDQLLELRHAILTRSEGHHYLVPVEGAGRPAAMNALPITARTRLQHGDVVSIGMSVFEYLDSEISEYADPFETVALRMPRFVLYGDVLLTPLLRIGRDPTCELFLDDPRVARRHAELSFLGRVFVVRSIEGSELTVDGRPVVEAALRSGDVIRLGPFDLRIDLDGFNCVVDVSRSSADDQVRFANDIESASPYQTLYRLPAPAKAKEEEKRGRGAPRWREPWDVRKSRRLPLLVGLSLVGVIALGGFALQGGGQLLVEQPLSTAHAKLESSGERCNACHGAFAGPQIDRCASCHETNKPRPQHRFGECTRCHVEHRSEDRLALVSSARCAECHADRHQAFRSSRATPGSATINASGSPVPAIKADLSFDRELRSLALHRRHGTVPRGCAACHQAANGEEISDPKESCFACHPGREATASSSCASCHREHGDDWAPPAPSGDLRVASALPSAGIGVVGLLFTMICGLLAHSFVQRLKRREETAPKKEESAAPGGKFEVLISYGKCVPIGACVKACPFDVLEMASLPEHGGKVLPKVVRPDACKACRACEEACGVKAISVVPAGEGAAALNIPELDANYESNIPGLYVIGEAAGKPLVKNASNLGLHVVNHMLASEVRPDDADRAGCDYELIVLGSGPAGLSAAVSAKRRGLRVLVLERDESYATTHRREYAKGKEVIAEPIDVENLGHLPVRTAPKEELLAAWGELIRAEGIEIRYHARVESIEKDDESFTVITESTGYRALRVVIATGTRGSPRRLAVPGADLPHVRFAMQDAADFADTACVVVGGGDSAMEIALMLSEAQRGRKGRVALIYRGASLKRGRGETRDRLETAAKEGRVALHLETNPVEIRERVMVIEFKGGKQQELPAEVVFCMLGAEPALEFLGRIGIRIVQKPADWDPGPTDVLVRRLIDEMNG